MTDTFEMRLRIIVENPLPGVAVALQEGPTGKARLVAPTDVSAERLIFDLEVTVSGSTADGGPRLLGPFVQGPPTGRFVYLCVGQAAHQLGSPWRGRTKAPLSGIGWTQINAARGRPLEARIAGQNAKGAPALATVPLLPPGWRPVAA